MIPASTSASYVTLLRLSSIPFSLHIVWAASIGWSVQLSRGVRPMNQTAFSFPDMPRHNFVTREGRSGSLGRDRTLDRFELKMRDGVPHVHTSLDELS